MAKKRKCPLCDRQFGDWIAIYDHAMAKHGAGSDEAGNIANIVFPPAERDIFAGEADTAGGTR